jgi:putative ABC transport system permease protein
VAGVLMMPGHVGAGANRLFVTVQGVNQDYLKVRNHGIEQGQFFTQQDIDNHSRVVALGNAMPGKLFGRRDVVGESVVIKGERYKVIAVMVKKGMIGFEDFDLRAFIPVTTAQEIYELDGYHSVLARARQGTTPEAARSAIDAALRKHLGLVKDDPADFSVSTVDELTGIIDHMTRVFRYLLYGIGSVALLASAPARSACAARPGPGAATSCCSSCSKQWRSHSSAWSSAWRWVSPARCCSARSCAGSST